MGREPGEGGAWKIAARFPDGLFDYLDTWGRPPLPPYIKRGAGDDPASDRDRYQTIYARDPGSVAAPTAGLHFTDAMMRRIEDAGARFSAVTLSVGIGTFLPIRTEEIERHRMHAERYDISPETAEAVNDTRERGGRVIAVGTTTTRALEGAAAQGQQDRLSSGRGETSLFITPGFPFPGSGRARDQLSPAEIDAVGAGLGVFGTRVHPRGVPAGREGTLPVLQLRRRDVDHVSGG